jgi:hypothetical protein
MAAVPEAGGNEAAGKGQGLEESRVTSDMFGGQADTGGAEGERAGGEDGKVDALQWYCFDDDLVYPVSTKEAVDGNFGSGAGMEGGGAGMLGLGGPTRGMIERMRASRSAYMLCYVRHDCLSAEHTTQLAVALQNVPAHVKDADSHGARSLPVSLSLLVAPAWGIAGAAPVDAPVDDGIAPSAGTTDAKGVAKGEGNAALVRGCPIEITVSKVEERTVQDIIEQSAQAASAKGQLVRPAPDLFQGAEVQRIPSVQSRAPAEQTVKGGGASQDAVAEGGGGGEGGVVAGLVAPQIGLALTAVGRNHMIVNVLKSILCSDVFL